VGIVGDGSVRMVRDSLWRLVLTAFGRANGVAFAARSCGEGDLMAEFAKFVLEDGSEVFFETAESDLVALHSGEPEVREGGRLGNRLSAIAEAAEEISRTLRSRLVPDEVTLEFGVKVGGEVNWWFFAKSQGEATIKVTARWSGGSSSGAAVTGAGE
jgi:Trypsin-co-occurring domain 1